MIADMHCHYPMHLLAEEPKDLTVEEMARIRRRPRWVDKLRASVLAFLARVLNYRRFSDEWRVNLDRLENGHVRVVFSVLYQPFAEMDLDEWPGSDPEDGYYQDLVDHMDAVEGELAELDPEGTRHMVVTNAGDLQEALAKRRVAIIHSVEGGFHLGRTPEDVREHVAELAGRGVAYITLAHLFWRKVATNAPALPFLPDSVYRLIFRQPPGAGLTELGQAAVRAMYEHRVMVDLSHMRQDAIDETFALLERLDKEHGADPRDYPVIASHAGYRFGGQTYMLAPEVITKIAARDGVVGLILAQHQLENGLPRESRDIDGTVRTIRAHVDKIYELTDSYAHVGIGSDLDGFIKPTVSGIEYADDLAQLEDRLETAYPGHGAAILSDNALRVVQRVLSARPTT